MLIEEFIWMVLNDEATMGDLMEFNLYNVYYIYTSLAELRKRIENNPGCKYIWRE